MSLLLSDYRVAGWRIAGQFSENPAALAIRRCASSINPPGSEH
jgi:hypothetical protein